MGLFRSLSVVAVSIFVLSVVNDNKKIHSIPLIGESINHNLKEMRHIIIIIVIALLELVL